MLVCGSVLAAPFGHRGAADRQDVADQVHLGHSHEGRGHVLSAAPRTGIRGAGLVVSLARPGGNFTGTTQQTPELVPKRLQLLVETLPRVSRVGVIWNAANPAFARPGKEIQGAGRTLGILIQSGEVRGAVGLRAGLRGHGREPPRCAALRRRPTDASARAGDREFCDAEAHPEHVRSASPRDDGWPDELRRR